MVDTTYVENFISQLPFTWHDRTQTQVGVTPLRQSLFGGKGFIAGISPGIVTVDGTPTSRVIELRDREMRKTLETTWSDPLDGSYRFDDLNLSREFELISRDHQRVYNDVVIPSVYPWAHSLQWVSSIPTFLFSGDSLIMRASGGVSPYNLSISSLPDDTDVELSLTKVTVEIDAAAPGGQTLGGTLTDQDSEVISFSIPVLHPDTPIAWRVNVGNSIGYCSMTELEFATTPGGTNICTGGTIIASEPYTPAVGTQHLAQNAFDGVWTNYTPEGVWASNIPNNQVGYLGYQPAVPTEIQEVRIGARWGGGSADQRPDVFYIEKLTRLGDWVRVRDVSLGGAGWTAGVMRAFPVTPNIVEAESYSMSSVYGTGYEADKNRLTNQRYVNNAPAATTYELGWIKADLGEPKLVDNVILGASTYSPFGSYYGYLNNLVIEWSNDDSSWTSVGTTTSTSTSNDVITPTGGVTARYWRARRQTADYLVTCQFRFTVNT